MELAFAFAAAAVIVAGLGVELRLFAPGRAPHRGEAIAWSTGWLLLAVAVAAAIALTGGPAGEWTTVYLIERSLSLDNVFLFLLLLAYFLVPSELRGRVIVIGILGALVLRGVAIAGSANPVLRLVRRALPITTDFRGRRQLIREEGRLYGTPLLLVVVAIIAADIAFAVDSFRPRSRSLATRS